MGKLVTEVLVQRHAGAAPIDVATVKWSPKAGVTIDPIAGDPSSASLLEGITKWGVRSLDGRSTVVPADGQDFMQGLVKSSSSMFAFVDHSSALAERHL